MRVSRSEPGGRLRRPALLVLALVLPLLTTGQAPGPPIPLVPPGGPNPPAAAPPAAPEAGPPAAGPPAAGAPGAITSEPLAAPAPGWSGDVAPARGALAPDFWAGTPRGLAELLLARLPDTVSPTLQALERRLLLSPGAAPQGQDAPGLSLPALRAAALLRLGELAAARTVIAAIPEAERGPALPVAVAAAAIAGDTDRACATVNRAIRQQPTAFWQKASIACQALQGEIDRARFGLQILAEQKVPHDPALAASVDALAGQAAPLTVERIEDPTPLLLRLLVKARRHLAPALVEKLRPDLALTLALDEAAPPTTQLLAAERAARFGALAPDRLRALYAALPEPRGPHTGSVFARARLYGAIAHADTPAERLMRIVTLAEALRAPKRGGLGFAARLVAPALRQITPAPALSGSAAAAARLLIAAGADDAARQWSMLVPGAAGRRLELLLDLAGGGGASGEVAGRDKEAPAPLLRLALHAALGTSIPTQAWLALPQGAWSAAGPPAPPAAPQLLLAAASRQKRIGETVLAAILTTGSGGVLTADPAVLHAAIAGLREVGLGGAAHRLAVEAALAAGL